MTQRSDLVRAFEDLAAVVLREVAGRHGMEIKQDAKGDVALKSSVCRVTLEAGSGHLFDLGVMLSPSEHAGARERARQFGLGVVLDHLGDPSVAFAARPLSSRADVAAELARIAMLLEAHCANILAGDFSLWPQLEAEREEALRLYEGGSATRRVWIAKSEAFAAFGRGDYRTAVQSYESISGSLSPRENAKLAYARQKLAQAE